jgi:hypothetical protein
MMDCWRRRGRVTKSALERELEDERAMDKRMIRKR